MGKTLIPMSLILSLKDRDREIHLLVRINICKMPGIVPDRSSKGICLLPRQKFFYIKFKSLMVMYPHRNLIFLQCCFREDKAISTSDFPLSNPS